RCGLPRLITLQPGQFPGLLGRVVGQLVQAAIIPYCEVQASGTPFQVTPGIGRLQDSMFAVVPVEPDRPDGTARTEDHGYPYKLLDLHGSPHVPVKAYHLADDRDLAGTCRNYDGLHVGVLRLQADLPLLPIKALQGGFSFHHGNYYVPVVRHRLWTDQSQIAIADTGIDHGVPPYPEKELAAIQAHPVQREIPLYVFHRRRKGPGPDRAENRQGDGGGGRRCQGNAPGVGIPLQKPFFLQSIQVPDGREGAGYAKVCAYLPQGGRIAVVVDVGCDEVQHLPLAVGW